MKTPKNSKMEIEESNLSKHSNVLRGLLLLALFGVFLSCEGQVRVNGTENGNGGWKFELTELQNRVDSLKVVLNESKSFVDDLEKTVASKNTEIETLSVSITNLIAEVSNLTTEAETNLASINILTADISTLKSTILELEVSIQGHLSDKNAMEVQITQLEADKKVAEDVIVSINAQLVTKNTELDQALTEANDWKSKYEQLSENPDIVVDTVFVPLTTIKVDGIDYEADKITKIFEEVALDTFITVSDPILLDFTDSLVQPTDKADVYVMVTGIGLVHLQDMDTVYRFQTMYEIEAKRDYSIVRNEEDIVTYRNLGLPFQFRKDESYVVSRTSTTITVRTFTTENCQVSFTANSIPNTGASGTGYNASNPEPLMFRHTRTLTGLEPSTDYLIQVWAETESGSVDLYNVNASTTE